jgi:hypothetical protein
MPLKSPFDNGGFQNLQTERIYGKRYKYRFEDNAGGLNKANLQPWLPDRSNRVTVKKHVAPGTKARRYCSMILVQSHG